jgi:hypothetical protein
MSKGGKWRRKVEKNLVPEFGVEAVSAHLL